MNLKDKVKLDTLLKETERKRKVNIKPRHQFLDCY
jgi:hypothetical protein